MTTGIVVFVIGLVSLVFAGIYTLVARAKKSDEKQPTNENKTTSTTGSTTDTPAKTGNGPTKIKSALWVLLALAFGVGIGCYLIWISSLS